MKAIIWYLSLFLDKLTITANQWEARCIRTLDRMDPHYADKRWVQMMNKKNTNKGVE